MNRRCENISRRPGSQRRRESGPARDNARMIELHMEGRSIRDVAAKTGWSKDTVWNVLREHREKTDAE